MTAPAPAGYLRSGLFWLLLGALAVGTFALRASFILFVDRLGDLPPGLERLLPYLPPAVLGALVAPAILVPSGTPTALPALPRVAAGLVGAAVAWRTENMLATVAAGMAVFWAAGAV